MRLRPAFLILMLAAVPAAADQAVTQCASCAAWNVPQTPFRIYGNTYYVGTHELSAILIASNQGKVAASPWSAQVLGRGTPAADDPQHDLAQPPYAGVPKVELLQDNQTLQVGPLALTAHFTPGHTPGGTSWSWTSCEKDRCLHMAYADSLTAVSADSYRFTDHPDLVAGFEKSFAVIDTLPCDILLTPHPGFSNTLQRLEARDKGGKPDAFIDASACKKLAQASRQGLAKRIAQEKSAR